VWRSLQAHRLATAKSAAERDDIEQEYAARAARGLDFVTHGLRNSFVRGGIYSAGTHRMPCDTEPDPGRRTARGGLRCRAAAIRLLVEANSFGRLRQAGAVRRPRRCDLFVSRCLGGSGAELVGGDGGTNEARAATRYCWAKSVIKRGARNSASLSVPA
jgi:hypothetical protein